MVDDNPLLQLWKEARGNPYLFSRGRLTDIRLFAAEKYSWAIPNEEALSVIAKHQPLLEGGAGLGYWASLLQKRGVDILPTDPNPPRKGWTVVLKAQSADLNSNRTLLLCWVPQDQAIEAAKLYKGNRIIWIGEPIKFPKFQQQKKIIIPRWKGYDDSLFAFQRKYKR